MIAKTVFLILVLPLMLGITFKRNNPQITKRNNSSDSLKQQSDTSERFKISRDTVNVDIEGTLYRGLLIHDKYYCFYEVRDPMSTLPIRKFYIIKKSGKIDKEIKLPKAILDDTYPKLYYWGDRIIVNTEFYKSSYYLDPDKGEFVKNQKIITVSLFEDENYQITSECHGEWGSTIHFKNKSTGITSSTSSGCPFLVNKLEDKYFINTSDMVNTDIIEFNAGIASITRFIFTMDNLFSHFYIPTSFVANGSLYHIYNSYKELQFNPFERKERLEITKDTIKIGIINDGKFKPVYTFKDQVDIELEQHLSPGYQICTFHTEKRLQVGFKKDIPPYQEGKYGFIEIIGNKIKIHYFFGKKAG